jgi:ABC-type nickel/cobalt efflux system permease component RcnA
MSRAGIMKAAGVALLSLSALVLVITSHTLPAPQTQVVLPQLALLLLPHIMVSVGICWLLYHLLRSLRDHEPTSSAAAVAPRQFAHKTHTHRHTHTHKHTA